jgi:hypothetical protein
VNNELEKFEKSNVDLFRDTLLAFAAVNKNVNGKKTIDHMFNNKSGGAVG